MPGDTLIITQVGDSLQLSDSLFHRQLASVPGHAVVNDNTRFFLVVLVFVLVIATPFFINWIRRRWLRNSRYRNARAHFEQYNEWLAEYNAYYKSLPPVMRQRFLERVAWFMAAKTFNCINPIAEEKMPLLISAASIQITFGLEKYQLDFFDTIYIMQQNYNYGRYEQPFEGHVNSNGIYLSWDNFVKGYEDYTDADNLGIHEMAHALAYVNFMLGTNDGQDPDFIKRFYAFSAVARPLFAAMQNGGTKLLNAYAATNYNEFWAVAVETFFEKPLHMKVEMPALYEAMCSLLNQDPLLPEKLREYIL
ncbi:MAG: zinc-dependent peptidase [Bacteroidota bacterium]